MRKCDKGVTLVNARLLQSYLPELLRRILTSNTLEDLRAAGVLVDELGDVVDGGVDDDVHALVGIVVASDFGGGEGLGHFGGRIWNDL